MTVHHDVHVGTHAPSHGMIDPLILSVSLSVFALFSYFLCIALALLSPPMAESMQALYPMIFPGFIWLTAESIIYGAIFVTIGSLYVGCGFALTYNVVCRVVRS